MSRFFPRPLAGSANVPLQFREQSQPPETHFMFSAIHFDCMETTKLICILGIEPGNRLGSSSSRGGQLLPLCVCLCVFSGNPRPCRVSLQQDQSQLTKPNSKLLEGTFQGSYSPISNLRLLRLAIPNGIYVDPVKISGIQVLVNFAYSLTYHSHIPQKCEGIIAKPLWLDPI
jgi:hypothetical protein